MVRAGQRAGESGPFQAPVGGGGRMGAGGPGSFLGPGTTPLLWVCRHLSSALASYVQAKGQVKGTSWAPLGPAAEGGCFGGCPWQ